MIMRLLIGILVNKANAGAESDLVTAQLGRVNYLGTADDILKLGNAPLNEGLFFTGGVVFGIFRKIPMFAGRGDGVDHSRPFSAFEMRKLLLD